MAPRPPPSATPRAARHQLEANCCQSIARWAAMPYFWSFVPTFSSELRNRRYRHQLASLRASKGCLLWSQLRSGGRRGRARGPFAARQRRASARRSSSGRDRPSPRPGRPRAARGPHQRACARRSARVLFRLSPAPRRPTAAAPRSSGAAPRLSVVDKPCFEPNQLFKRPRGRPRRRNAQVWET